MTTSIVAGIPIIEGLISTRNVKRFDGLLDGQGKWIDPISGDIWDGVFVNGTIKYGKLKQRNGLQYIGDFFEGEPSGKGTILWPNQMKFEGYHKKFLLEEGEMFFPNGERHEGIWVNNVPGQDGIRKYPNGGRSKGPIYSMQLSKDLQRYRVIFKSTGEKRVFEIWNGNKHIRESVEGVIPKESIVLELPFLNACSNGDLKEVERILGEAPLLARFAYEMYQENNTIIINPALLLAVERNQVHIVRHLLLSGADIATVDQNMYNSFHVATKRGNYEILELLCNMSIDYEDYDVHPLDFKDKNGLTPLGLGWELFLDGQKKRIVDKDKALEKCIRVLMNHGADPGDRISIAHEEIGGIGLGFLWPSAPKLETIVHKYDRQYRSLPSNISSKKRRTLATDASIWNALGL